MKHEIYPNLSITDDFSIFEFLSVGPKGTIPKRIEFTLTEYSNIYNLAFGDVKENGEINDYSISNNGDRDKILATIYHVVEIYLRAYPHRWIYFKGSTEERTRLYRIAIGLNLEELTQKFDIYSRDEASIAVFQKNMPLVGILVKRKF